MINPHTIDAVLDGVEEADTLPINVDGHPSIPCIMILIIPASKMLFLTGGGLNCDEILSLDTLRSPTVRQVSLLNSLQGATAILLISAGLHPAC